MSSPDRCAAPTTRSLAWRGLAARHTRCVKPRSSSRAGDVTTTPFGRMPLSGTNHQLPRSSCLCYQRGRLRHPDRLRRPRWRQRQLSTNIPTPQRGSTELPCGPLSPFAPGAGVNIHSPHPSTQPQRLYTTGTSDDEPLWPEQTGWVGGCTNNQNRREPRHWPASGSVGRFSWLATYRLILRPADNFSQTMRVFLPFQIPQRILSGHAKAALRL